MPALIELPKFLFYFNCRYYLGELGFYVSLLLTMFADAKRSDFTIHLIHHIITIILISVSWLTHYFRIGNILQIIQNRLFFAAVTIVFTRKQCVSHAFLCGAVLQPKRHGLGSYPAFCQTCLLGLEISHNTR